MNDEIVFSVKVSLGEKHVIQRHISLMLFNGRDSV
jgi:hypothetical protein